MVLEHLGVGGAPLRLEKTCTDLKAFDITLMSGKRKVTQIVPTGTTSTLISESMTSPTLSCLVCLIHLIHFIFRTTDMNLINELRMLAEDLHVNGYSRYSSAMSQAADELAKWEAVFGHLGNTPDECGNAIIAARDELEGRCAALTDELRLAVRQNSHDMLMTGDELRQCEAAMEK